MKSAVFQYAGCKTAQQALEALSASEDMGKLCSGTQSLGPMLNLRLVQVDQLIDVSRVDSMLGFELGDTALRVGAAVTHARIEDGALPDVTHGLLPSVAATIAYRAVRNRGTLGGSLAHADPAADWVSTMCLLGAGIVVQSRNGERTVPATEFFEGPFTTQLQLDELIVAVQIPHFGTNARWAYRKQCRKPGEFAEALSGIWVDAERGIGRLVLRGLDRMPYVVEGIAAVDAMRDPQSLGQTLDTIGLEDPYERQLLKAMVRRAFIDLDAFKP